MTADRLAQALRDALEYVQDYRGEKVRAYAGYSKAWAAMDEFIAEAHGILEAYEAEITRAPAEGDVWALIERYAASKVDCATNPTQESAKAYAKLAESNLRDALAANPQPKGAGTIHALQCAVQRALSAWDTTTLKTNGDGMLCEAVESMRAAFDDTVQAPAVKAEQMRMPCICEFPDPKSCGVPCERQPNTPVQHPKEHE